MPTCQQRSHCVAKNSNEKGSAPIMQSLSFCWHDPHHCLCSQSGRHSVRFYRLDCSWNKKDYLNFKFKIPSSPFGRCLFWIRAITYYLRLPSIKYWKTFGAIWQMCTDRQYFARLAFSSLRPNNYLPSNLSDPPVCCKWRCFLSMWPLQSNSGLFLQKGGGPK